MTSSSARTPLLPTAATRPSESPFSRVGRVFAVAWIETRTAWRRPIYIIFTALLVLLVWAFLMGNVRVQAGDVTAGGKQAWINSMFNAAFVDSALLGLLLPFLAAVTAGMPLIADADRRVDRMVLATQLSPSQYVFGRWLGTLIPLVLCLAMFVLAQVAFFQFWPIDDPAKSRGAFDLWNFVFPALLFGAPTLVAVAGTSMLLGIWSRQAILVFLLPIANLLCGVFFLWGWSPEWLPHWANVLLMQVDPTGNRWLAETWLKSDRGVEYYNTQPVGVDALFALSRLVWIAVGLAAAWLSARIVGSRLRGAVAASALVARPATRSTELQRATRQSAARQHFGAMTMRQPSVIAGTLAIMRYEVRALLRSPGIWLFTPIIILQIIGTNSVNEVWLGTIRLATSGTLAAGAFNTVTLLLIFLSLFYTVESLNREERHGMSAIVRASGIPTIAMLGGKVLANAVLAIIIAVGALFACIIVILVQWFQTKIFVPINLGVFFMLWGVVLAPTLILWCAWIALVHGLVRNRYATYAVGLGTLILTGWLQTRGYLNWATNWHLWSALVWSDLDRLEFLRPSIVANRLFVIYTACIFVLGAIALYPRRVRDVQRTVDAMQPARIGKALLKWSPLIVIWLVAGGWIWIDARDGFQGAVMERKGRDYWKRNEMTFRNVAVPKIDAIDADIEIIPETRRLVVKGNYVLSNQQEKPISQIPLTPGAHFDNLKWTLGGVPIEPQKDVADPVPPSIEDRAGLWVVTLDKPLTKGETVTIGFSWDGYFPRGWTKNGGGTAEFVLPSGVVLTSFSPSMLPSVGYLEGVGVDERNDTDPPEPERDAWKGVTDPAFGSAWGSDVAIRVTGPADWQLNACGEAIDETVNGDRKTVSWKTEHPVRFFNICGGPLVEKTGDGVAVWFNPQHEWNVETMKGALENSRKFYGEWFAPFPRKELRLTEFPGLATYAQGFPGNITFSESIGFLARPGGDDELDAVYFVTAHEAGHQWWGNMLMPGKGLGGNILSEGMANFSAWMLTRECRGEDAAQHVLREWENSYANSRSADSERPLVRTSGTRPGDTAVQYDKGGWVFVMMMEMMGRDAMLAGLKDFIAKFRDGPDFPLLQDFVVTMREHAKDPSTFDAFTNQWFERVVVPEFKVRDLVVRGQEGEPQVWTTTATIENVGSGRVTIDVSALKSVEAASDEAPIEREVVTVTLGPGGASDASKSIEFKTSFAPAIVRVDPDVRMLQLRRKLAEARP